MPSRWIHRYQLKPAPLNGWWPSIISVARRSSTLGKARTPSNGRGFDALTPVHWTDGHASPCRKFRDNAVRLQLHTLAYNLANFMRTTGFAEGGGALVIDDATGEAGQDWRQGREPRSVCHFPTGGGCGAKGAVPKNPPPHRWAAAGPYAAMTAAHPVASRSPDRTGVCGAGRSAPSQCEKVPGRAFDRQIGPTRKGDRNADCRIRTGFDVNRRYCYATRDREWSSGKSRLSSIRRRGRKWEKPLMASAFWT